MSEASARLSINVYVECPSRQALSSCSEIPNSSDHASRQAIECEPVAWLISKGEEKEVMFDSEYDRNDRNHDEKRGWKYDPLFTHANSDEWIKCSDRMPDVRCLAFTPSDHEEVRYRIVPERILKALSEATHWMPLPEPPKQEQGQ